MRNLQECQAEVFRRSEQRMQARKRLRRRIQTTCILLVLCLAACGAYFLPPEETPPAAGKMEMQLVTENLLAGAGLHYAGGSIAIDGEPAECGSVTVSGGGTSYSYTSLEKVQSIIDIIDIIVNAPETTITTDFIDKFGKNHNPTITTDDKLFAYGDFMGDGNFQFCYAPPIKWGYDIIVTHANGTVDEYHLDGFILTNLATGEVFHMTAVAHFALKDALGLLSD